jgi:predicted dithiol-disulfide oxidoreductase (DUF899 family)
MCLSYAGGVDHRQGDGAHRPHARRPRPARAERARLRRQIERVAAQRRELPPGGEVPEDYVCTSIIDGLGRVLAFARGRGWNLRFVSSAGNSYNHDYHGEDREGRQWPMMNVFRKTDRIRHTWGSELIDAPEDPGHNARHVDLLWSLWNVLDLTPSGRGSDWYPRLEY